MPVRKNTNKTFCAGEETALNVKFIIKGILGSKKHSEMFAVTEFIYIFALA